MGNKKAPLACCTKGALEFLYLPVYAGYGLVSVWLQRGGVHMHIIQQHIAIFLTEFFIFFFCCFPVGLPLVAKGSRGSLI